VVVGEQDYGSREAELLCEISGGGKTLAGAEGSAEDRVTDTAVYLPKPFNYPQISMGYCPTRFGLKADTYGDLMVDAGLLSCRSDGAVQAKLRNELRAGSARS
jgi:hypothetical protein